MQLATQLITLASIEVGPNSTAPTQCSVYATASGLEVLVKSGLPLMVGGMGNHTARKLLCGLLNSMD